MNPGVRSRGLNLGEGVTPASKAFGQAKTKFRTDHRLDAQKNPADCASVNRNLTSFSSGQLVASGPYFRCLLLVPVVGSDWTGFRKAIKTFVLSLESFVSLNNVFH